MMRGEKLELLGAAIGSESYGHSLARMCQPHVYPTTLPRGDVLQVEGVICALCSNLAKEESI